MQNRRTLWAWLAGGGIALAAMLISLSLPDRTLRAESSLGSGVELEEACSSCHATAVAQFRLTLHGKLFRDQPRGALEKANCEACHGPLDKHAENPDDPASITSLRRVRQPNAKIRSAPCLTCHQTDAQFDASHAKHLKAGVACSDCHSVMRPVATTKLLSAADAFALCTSCHPSVAGQQHARSTHIAAASGLTCIDCHNPHGAGRGALKAGTVNDTCAPCHRAQSGPFLFEHAPVEENCMTCHTPHGAPQPSLLKMNTGSLCLSCHSQAPFFHSFTGMDRFTLARSCANCHTQIHGSNHATGSRLMR